MKDVIKMDQLGIERCWSSDHYMPWSHTSASGGAAWPWLGSALARTNKIMLGTGVTTPTLRYHPAIVAQIFATLGYMFPKRVFLGVGRGEALNEVPAGNVWPLNNERFKRLKESIFLIKKLWSEKLVSFKGDYYWVKNSNLYTKPKDRIPIYIAGSGPQSARLAGEEGDGFVTNELDRSRIKNVLFPAVKEGAKKSGKEYGSMEKILFVPTSYHEDREKALESIRFWRGSMIKAFLEVDIHDPRKIEDDGQMIGDDTLQRLLFVISSPEEAINKLKQYFELGFTEIVLTNSSPNREDLIKLITERIAPSFK